MPTRDKNYLKEKGWGVIGRAGDHFEIISPLTVAFSSTAQFPTAEDAWQRIYEITLQPRDWDIFDKDIKTIGPITIFVMPEEPDFD